MLVLRGPKDASIDCRVLRRVLSDARDLDDVLCDTLQRAPRFVRSRRARLMRLLDGELTSA
jgi:hypothetical protein